MLDPYRMIFVNIVASILLFGGAVIYKFIYPKKKINLFVLLLLISFLPLISLLRMGTYESGDLSLHAFRSTSYYQILSSEHILPRWSPLFYGGYGDPYFGFAYFLPYFVISIFHWLGFTFISSVKLLFAASYIFSGVFMYLFAKDHFGKIGGFVAAIFYLFAPYHLLDMHFRATIAEPLSFTFLPLSLFLIRKALLRPSIKYFCLLSVSLTLLILSHQVIALTSLAFMFLYVAYLIFENKSLFKNLKALIASFIFSLMLSAFYWLPALIESKYTQQALIQINYLRFPTIAQLIYSPYRFGLLFQGPHGELSYLIGYAQLFSLAITIFILFKIKITSKIRRWLLFLISVFIFLFFMISSFSKPIWEVVPLLKQFQFSTRLLVIVSLCTSLMAGVVSTVVNKKAFIIMLCGLAIFSTILNWGNRRTIPTISSDDTLLKTGSWMNPMGGSKIGLEPSSPIWANQNRTIYLKPRSSNIDILSGNASIKENFRNSTKHNYSITVTSKLAQFKENTFYFPGWKIYDNNKSIKINYTQTKYEGLILFDLPKGKHHVLVSFEDTYAVLWSRWISILTTFALGILMIANSLLPKLKIKRS